MARKRKFVDTEEKRNAGPGSKDSAEDLHLVVKISRPDAAGQESEKFLGLPGLPISRVERLVMEAPRPSLAKEIPGFDKFPGF